MHMFANISTLLDIPHYPNLTPCNLRCPNVFVPWRIATGAISGRPELYAWRDLCKTKHKAILNFLADKVKILVNGRHDTHGRTSF